MLSDILVWETTDVELAFGYNLEEILVISREKIKSFIFG
jgi:hypothetical protein